MRSRILFATVLALGAGASAQVSPHISSLLKRADNGDVVAQFTLARAYQDGREVKRDHAQALKWYQKAADRGESASQCNLGRMYADASGVPRDDTIAVKWYLRAAVQLYPPAMTNLGYMYAAGRGIGQD